MDEKEEKEVLPVVFAHTLVDPDTMVVERRDADAAQATVF